MKGQLCHSQVFKPISHCDGKITLGFSWGWLIFNVNLIKCLQLLRHLLFPYILHYNISETLLTLEKRFELWLFQRHDIHEMTRNCCQLGGPFPTRWGLLKWWGKHRIFFCSQWKSNTFEWELSWHSRMSKCLRFHSGRLVALVSVSEVKRWEWGCCAWDLVDGLLPLTKAPSQHIQPPSRLFLPCYMALN